MYISINKLINYLKKRKQNQFKEKIRKPSYTELDYMDYIGRKYRQTEYDTFFMKISLNLKETETLTGPHSQHNILWTCLNILPVYLVCL